MVSISSPDTSKPQGANTLPNSFFLPLLLMGALAAPLSCLKFQTPPLSSSSRLWLHEFTFHSGNTRHSVFLPRFVPMELNIFASLFILQTNVKVHSLHLKYIHRVVLRLEEYQMM
jgi:hypothetical protein